MLSESTQKLKKNASKIHLQDRPDCWLFPRDAVKEMFIASRRVLHGDSIQEAEKAFEDRSERWTYYGKPMLVFQTDAEYKIMLQTLTEDQGLRVGVPTLGKPPPEQKTHVCMVYPPKEYIHPDDDGKRAQG